MELKEMQKKVYENKVNKGFNTTNVEMEFCLLYGEVAEAYEAYLKNKSKEEIGSELADIAIYTLGLSQILGLSLQDEIEKKMKINEKREYVYKNGVLVKKDEVEE